ncbi:putative transcription factor C2H2 family [Helianthus annuus]|uniref:Transcription factor C2H2 family n=2 Tax=Helianthus annuus TaxID=4232 RepID=A0A9K3EDZ1_HELAN|nr:general negative regulator of transcription subunit 4 [Helianthus annuus]KAF5770826.1 putative transcription factor C2H2 family [Helianthus annuus]KAJ0465692.1 putative transcription factor C2H2 family [Helianthus annuus]KAJ0487283.1 putative transcription factor C2H2 family [Helianthus annuus]KAJ0661394.1 putative transcription factor C2H2 family [Helianthus annuus]KAJ0842028.1 putative transcription factor C2H2 family [Helianthus annuus]
MSNEEEKRCPLCAEEMDWTDQQLKPCKCGYEVCVWCWHHIMDMAEKDATEGRCPACRTAYDKDRSVGLESNFQRVAGSNLSRKQKQPKAKPKPTEVKKDLSNVRVIQRKMAYIIGLPLSLADEDLLQRRDYFGRYGKVTKVSLSRTAGGTVQQFVNDTCSVYITYSKEEEAVRCIQSVHGYVLDGRFLRASFGTAKYCHAWLRNMPCNNAACLYLHSIGAEEDSFGKDEIAAVHTRNRVQEIVGATQYLHNRSGSMLPPPVDEHLHNRSAAAPEPVFSSAVRDVAYAAVASGDHLHCSKDKDGVIKSSKHMTSFVDIVGRSSNSGSDKDISSVSQGQIPSLCSDMSSVCINDKTTDSDLVSSKSSTYSEPFREASKLADSTLKDTNIIKERSGSALDSQTSLNSSYPVEVIKDYSDQAWWQMESSSQNGFGVNNYAEEAFKQSTSTNTKPVLNDGYDEQRFGSLAKSDRIYGGSRSFSNEEIVEHLRRLDDDSRVDNDENSAAVESSIISNILSMDFDGCDDSVLPQTVTGLFERKDLGHGSSWSFQNSDHSRFSFANENGHNNQELGRFSAFQDSREIQDSVYKPQYQGSRAQNVIPPGFSKPPPGFPSSMCSEQVVSATSGSYLKNSLPNNRYHLPSTGDLSNNGDDLIDPSMMVVGRGKSSIDTRSSSFDEEAKLWLLMQQQSASATHRHHEPQFSQTSFTQQHHTPQFPSSRDDRYGDITSRLVDRHHQSYAQQQQYSQPKFSNGHIINGYQQLHLDESQQVKYSPGYGEFMHQMPSSGDVYTRVFGM